MTHNLVTSSQYCLIQLSKFQVGRQVWNNVMSKTNDQLI